MYVPIVCVFLPEINVFFRIDRSVTVITRIILKTCLSPHVPGAALGPLLTGLITPYGWQNVFFMLIAADICALLVSLYIIVSTHGGVIRVISQQAGVIACSGVIAYCPVSFTWRTAGVSGFLTLVFLTIFYTYTNMITTDVMPKAGMQFAS